MWALWGVGFFGLFAVVQMALVSEAVRFDRRRPGAYARLTPSERLRWIRPNLWAGLASLNLAGLATYAASDGNWRFASVCFALEAVVLLLGAHLTMRALRATR